MWVQKTPPTKKPALTPLLRPQPGAHISGELCGEPLRIFLHYVSCRSWPCVGRSCWLCEQHIARRYYAYYPVRNSKGVLGIMELTGQAEGQLCKQMKPYSQTPCGNICIERPHGRRNSPCIVHWKEPTNNKASGCGPVEVRELQAALMRIWKLPDNDQDLDEREYLTTLNQVIKHRVGNTTKPP